MSTPTFPIFYNENDPKAAAWLDALMIAGKIESGPVFRGDIRLIEAKYPAPRSHFFAGIGGWPLALDLAGWPREAPVWTGSCPCQPFSSAGRKRGFDDDRHLWPAWFRLITLCRPSILFGEQVASPAGRAWLDVVSADLENAGYAVGAADLCAAGVGAPHLRQRLYFVAIADGQRRQRLRLQLRKWATRTPLSEAFGRGATLPRDGSRSLGNPGRDRGRRTTRAVPGAKTPGERERQGLGNLAHLSRAASGLGDPGRAGREGHPGNEPRANPARSEILSPARPAPASGPWSRSEWVACRDGKHRPVEPGTQPLADGVPARVVKLRGYGNAVVPPLAAEFVKAAMEVLCQ